MEKYGIQQVWIGRVCELNVQDRVFKGKISATLANVEPYVLIMKFSNEDGLTRYYMDEEHSDIRKELFEKLDPRIKVLYDATKSGPLANDKAVAYEAIESIAGKYIHRRDYLDDEMIREMVRTEPYQC